MAAEHPPEVLGWAEITATVQSLADRIRRDGIPDVVVGVLRGGAIPSVLLAHALGVRTVRTLEVLHTERDGVDAAKTAVPRVFNLPSLGDITGLDTLIADDIAGSGDTITLTGDLVRAAGAARVRTALCVVNAANWRHPQAPEQVLTYVGATVERWVIFPWETKQP